MFELFTARAGPSRGLDARRDHAVLLLLVGTAVHRLFEGGHSARRRHGLPRHLPPLVDEMAAVMLASLMGWKMTVVHVAVGMGLGIVAGLPLDRVR